MKNNNNNPIFIHSLFRSGSTYIFNVFRRSDRDYYCYQEPLNEFLLNAAIEPDKLLEIGSETQIRLRHPKLQKPYFYEFYEVVGEVAQNFCKGFSYDQYFTKEKDEINSLNRYFNALEEGAIGRAVFQCCRTSGRVEQLKSNLGGTHIFLWRNPWDQWWSYKKENCFDTSNLLILNANNLPNFLNILKEELNLPSFHDEDLSQEAAFFNKHKLDFVGSYKIFYALWCHHFFEAKPHCELSINIDHLSTSEAYRNLVLAELKRTGVEEIDFSDCSVPMAVYGESDRDFFLPIEAYIHELLLLDGYSSEQVNELKKLSDERKEKIVDTSNPKNFTVRDAMRAREFALQASAEISATQNLAEAKAEQAEAEAKAEQAEVKAEQAEAKAEQAKAKAEQAKAKAEQAEAKAEQAEAKAEQAEAKVEQLHIELHSVYVSRSWRITWPLRRLIQLIRLVASVSFRLTLFLVRLPKRSFRWFLIKVMGFVVKHPGMKTWAKRRLIKYPNLTVRLRQIALAVGLVEPSPQNSVSPNLTPDARRILAELRSFSALKGSGGR